MLRTTTLALAVLMPGLALAQPPPDPATTRTEAEPAKKAKENSFVIEGFVGPVQKKYPDASGLAYGGAFRFVKHTGLRTDLGLLVWGSQYSAEGVLTPDGAAFDNDQSQIGGGLELNLGFGVSVVEIMGGAGLGLTWLDGTLSVPGGRFGDREYDNHPAFLVSYGGAIAVNAGPVRPVFRLTKVIDTEFDSEGGQAGDAGGLLLLFGVGVRL